LTRELFRKKDFARLQKTWGEIRKDVKATNRGKKRWRGRRGGVRLQSQQKNKWSNVGGQMDYKKKGNWT